MAIGLGRRGFMSLHALWVITSKDGHWSGTPRVYVPARSLGDHE